LTSRWHADVEVMVESVGSSEAHDGVGTFIEADQGWKVLVGDRRQVNHRFKRPCV
jgi:hypothetical protein